VSGAKFVWLDSPDRTIEGPSGGILVKGVVLAAGEGNRLRPLTEDRPKGLVEVAGTPLLSHCFEQLIELGIEELVVVIGYRGDQIVDHYGDRFRDTPLRYVHQDEPLGIAHALLCAEPFVDDDFALLLGDNVFDANLQRVLDRQRLPGVEASVLVEQVSQEDASRYGVCVTDGNGELLEVVEKPDDPPSTLVLTGFYTFTTRIFEACRAVGRSDRGEYELSDAISRLLRDGHTVDVVRLDGWRVDVGYPADRDEAERRLEGG
jgi:glucose-1-phosphate thymidylyltransferase